MHDIQFRSVEISFNFTPKFHCIRHSLIFYILFWNIDNPSLNSRPVDVAASTVPPPPSILTLKSSINLILYFSVFVTNLTGRQVENRFCTVLYRFLHLLQARPGQAGWHFQSPKVHLCGRVSRAAETGCRDSLVWYAALLPLLRATQAARTCQNLPARANGSCWREAASHWSRGRCPVTWRHDSLHMLPRRSPANVANDIIDIFHFLWKPSNFSYVFLIIFVGKDVSGFDDCQLKFIT